MRLLFITPQLPYPPDKGTRIRNFGLIKELARRHDVAVLSFGEPDPAARAGLAGHCRVLDVLPPPRRTRVERALRAALDPAPDLARRLASPAFTARLAEALARERWDILQVEGLEMAPHWLAVADRAECPPAVLDAHNAEWILQLRAARVDAAAGRVPGALYSAIQALKLRRYEGRAVAGAAGLACVSETDRRALARVGQAQTTAIVPNGVDTAALPMRAAASALVTRRLDVPDELDSTALAMRAAGPINETVLFTGTMDYRPNVEAVVWFAAEVWPRVRAVRPAARFVVAGRDPAASVRALAGRDGITVTGAVPDTAPLFAAAAVYVAPLRVGGGMRLKILEAFAHGTPVVSTRLGAEGIAIAPGREAILADRPADLAAGIVAILADPALGQALAEAGRRLVERRYDWRAIAPALELLHESVLAARPGLPRPVRIDVDGG